MDVRLVTSCTNAFSHYRKSCLYMPAMYEHVVTVVILLERNLLMYQYSSCSTLHCRCIQKDRLWKQGTVFPISNWKKSRMSVIRSHNWNISSHLCTQMLYSRTTFLVVVPCTPLRPGENKTSSKLKSFLAFIQVSAIIFRKSTRCVGKT